MSNQGIGSSKFWLIPGSAVLAIVGIATVGLLDDSRGKSFTPDPTIQREISLAKKTGKQGNWREAALKFEQYAATSNPVAKYELGLLYSRGWGVKRDLEKARILLLQAVQYDFPARARAAFELGRLFRKSRGEDCPRIAFEWFSKALDWGYVKAHSELGKSHARGLGVDVDVDKALFHYRAAVQHGSPSAVVPLINLIALGGKHLTADPDKALELLGEFMPLLETSAKKGDALAARALGRIYKKNSLIESDPAKAMYWLSAAATLGDAAAMHDLAKLMMLQTDKDEKKNIIVDLLHESSKRGYSGAFTALGRLHLTGEFGLPKDEAVYWFRKGVKAGHPGSMEELGTLLLNGRYVEKDLKEARSLAKLGSRLKHTGSIELLKKIDGLSDQTKATPKKQKPTQRG